MGRACASPLSQPRKRFNSLPRDIMSSEDSLDTACNSTIVKDSKYHRKNNCHKTKEIFDLPPPCTCPYFGEFSHQNILKPTEVKIISTSSSFLSTITTTSSLLDNNSTVSISDSMAIATTVATTTQSSLSPISPPPSSGSSSAVQPRKHSYSKTNSVVTWDTKRNQRRGSSFGGVRTSLLLTPTKVPISNTSPLRRSATLRNHNNIINFDTNNLNNKSIKAPSSPCLLQRSTTIRSHHSRNSSVISRNSSRHGRIIRLEQKATKVLGVVFFTFVILWAPFFVLNLLPSLCRSCEENMSHWVFDVVTWLGYASSMVNPIFYTIFNKVFRQAFKKVLLCQYSKSKWRPHR